MSEEIQNLPSEEQVINNLSETVDIDPYEETAKSQGWKPKEEYEGEPSKWRPAKEFVERGELFSKIDSMGRELKETRKAMRMLQDHHSQVKQVEYKKALAELKSLQKKHLEEGNADGYLETSEILTDLQAEQKAREIVTQTTTPAVDPRFLAWTSRNSWYNTDQDMRDHADIIGQRYAAQHPDEDPEEVLKVVEKMVKERFPQKFMNPNRMKPGTVTNSNTPNTKTPVTFEMSDDEKKVMNTFVRTGVMSKDDYIAQLKLIRGVV